VAVGSRPCHAVDADVSASPRYVLDDHRLTEPFSEVLSEKPGVDIDDRARAKRHHQGDGAIRVTGFLGSGQEGKHQRGAEKLTA
jgi:hypothetical protein